MHDKSDKKRIPHHAYVIDLKYRLISLDRETQKLFPEAKVGDYCYQALQGLTQICEDCPWKTRLESGVNQALVFNHVLGAWVDLSYMTLEWLDHGECIVINAFGIEHKTKSPHQPKAQNHYDQLLERDPLTGLYTPHVFYDKAEALVHKNSETTYEVIYIDIEHFKIFNERYGRDAGDEILKEIARELLMLRDSYGGIVGYIGGDDFIIILPRGTAEHEDILKRLSDALKKPAYDIECLPAIGVTTIHDLSIPISTYCDHAMTAMNVVKGKYTSRIAWYEDTMTRRLEEEPKALLEIEQALKNKEFILHYQPKCNLKTGKIIGLEALVRWQHPTRGLVFPGDFIPFLERIGLIANLDLLVWEEACRQIRDWTDRGLPVLPVSVNISRADIQFVDVVHSLESLLKEYDIDKSLLELEITESAFIEDAEIVLEAVLKLSERGFTLLMDDFGSGYSSLNMLKDIPVDVLKIDMHFLTLSDNGLSRGESILDAIVGMAHLMGLPVIAEGVETKEQVDFLKTINCDFVQGYYFYKPLALESLEALLVQKNIIDIQGTKRELVEPLNPVDLVQNYVSNKTILDSILGGMAIYGISNDELELIQANNRYFQLIGSNPPSTEEERLAFFRTAPKEVVEELVGLFEEAEKHPIGGAEDEFCQRRADGLYIWIKVKAFFLSKEGEKRIFFGKITDISVQKNQEDILRTSEDALSKALDLLLFEGGPQFEGESSRSIISAFIRNIPGAMIGFVAVDLYPILFANSETAFILGYTSYSEFLEKTKGEFENSIHADDLEEFKGYLMRKSYSGSKGTIKVRLRRKSGNYDLFAVQGKVIKREDNRSFVLLHVSSMDKINTTMVVDVHN